LDFLPERGSPLFYPNPRFIRWRLKIVDGEIAENVLKICDNFVNKL